MHALGGNQCWFYSFFLFLFFSRSSLSFLCSHIFPTKGKFPVRTVQMMSQIATTVRKNKDVDSAILAQEAAYFKSDNPGWVRLSLPSSLSSLSLSLSLSQSLLCLSLLCLFIFFLFLFFSCFSLLPPRVRFGFHSSSSPQAVAQAAVKMAEGLGARAIVVPSKGGTTAHMVSACRPTMPIVALALSEDVARQLLLCYGGVLFVV